MRFDKSVGLSRRAFVAALAGLWATAPAVAVRSRLVTTKIPRVPSESLGIQGASQTFYEIGALPVERSDGQIVLALIKAMKAIGLGPSSEVVQKFGMLPPLNQMWKTEFTSLSAGVLNAYNADGLTSEKLDSRRGWAVSMELQLDKSPGDFIFSTRTRLYEGRAASSLREYDRDFNQSFFHNWIYQAFMRQS